MAHIPLIHGADGAKLSKRHGALGVEAYRAMGYLPEALRNYLARLGWSHGDDEVMCLDDMIRWFEIEDVNKGAARFDFAKLEALNGVHMRQMDDAELLDIFVATLPYLEERPGDRRPSRRPTQGAAAGRHAGPEGARQDAGRTRRRRRLPVRRAAAADRREGGGAARWRAAREILRGAHAALEDGRGRLDGRCGGSRDPRVCAAGTA